MLITNIAKDMWKNSNFTYKWQTYCIKLVANPDLHVKIKYVKIQHYFIKRQETYNSITNQQELDWMKNKLNIAKFTINWKALTVVKIPTLSTRLGQISEHIFSSNQQHYLQHDEVQSRDTKHFNTFKKKKNMTCELTLYYVSSTYYRSSR